MIARLSGTVLSRRATEVILDVGGVGYRIHAPTSTIEKLPQEGKQAVLHTHLHVREDAMQMYGFVTEEALSVFETMLAVSGVGPKLALAALSAMTPSELRASVTGGDAAMLTRIPGVGRKTAERMILELRDRFAALDGTGLSTAMSAGTSSDGSQSRADALAALVSLGYNKNAAEKALLKVIKANPDATSTEALVRLSLREG
jgi:holliday junction DNA helicase RuvA